MEFSEKQIVQLDEIIVKAQDFEFKRSIDKVAFAVKEWQENAKTNQEAYDKIYKKVIKSEYYISNRYANINEERKIQIVAELFIENIIDHDLYDALDIDIRNKVIDIVRIKK